MWARILTILCLLFATSLSTGKLAAGFYAPFMASSNNPAVVCNFQTGVATGTGSGTCVSSLPTCNGSADDTASFEAFATWAVSTWQASYSGKIQLYIPSGLTCTLDTASIPFDGILNLQVSGYGASLKTQTNGYYHLGSAVMYQDSAHSVRLNAANAGDTTITVNPASATQPASGSPLFGCGTTSACASLFTVGKLAIIAGFDQQTGNGFPYNPFYYEYVTPTNINTSTGVIQLAAPLQYSYETTWPQFGFGAGTLGNNEDYGGPATLYALPVSYNATFEYDGLTFVQATEADNEFDIGGANVIIKDATMTFSGLGCFFPTQNQHVTIINVTATNCTMEVDKIDGDMTITNSTWSQLAFQSASPHTVTLAGDTIANLVGTNQSITINNSTISTLLRPGPSNYGRTDTLTVSNSTIAAVAAQSSASYGGLTFDGASNEGVNNISGATMSSGTISIPKTYLTGNEGAFGWANPGNVDCWGDNSGASYVCVQPFTITDVSQSGSNIIITTSQSGGFPTWTSQGKLYIRVWAAANVDFTSDTGSSGEAAMLSLPDCQNLPLYTCYEATYSSASSAASALNYWGMWGQIKRLEYNVTTAYNGAIGTATLNSGPTIFNNAVNASLATVSVDPVVNLKSLGDRLLDASAGFPATWSCTGACSGDSGVSGTISSALAAYALVKDTITNVSGTPGSPSMAVTVKQLTNPGVTFP